MEAFLGLGLIILFFIIVFYKKKKQVGKTWDGCVSAKVTINDQTLSCSHCGHDKFAKREGLINTTWVTLFRFPFFNKSARCFVCKNCGYLHWFVDTEEKSEIERTD